MRTAVELHAWLTEQIASGTLSPDAIVTAPDLYGSTNRAGGIDIDIYPPEDGLPQRVAIYGEWA